MGVRIVLSSVIGLSLVGPVLAGPCTQRLADLEKSITAKQEGGGPALGNSTPAGSSGPAASSSQEPPKVAAAQSPADNNAMQMLQQAKELDRQGKEAECMQMATKIGGMAPPATK
jgi:hypothetical protein